MARRWRPWWPPVEVKLVEQTHGAKAATLRLVKVNVNGDMRGVRTSVAKADADESGLSTRLTWP
ncbi:MAG: hypothetical protein ABJC36_08085 [Gemmatimonadales bacterium]